MSKILKIKQAQNPADLANFLTVFSKFKNGLTDYIFSVIFLDGVSDGLWNGSYLDFEKHANESEQGMLLNLEETIRFSEKMGQFYDLLLLIDSDVQNIRRYSKIEDEIMYQNCFASIAYFDGGYWEISCKEDSILKELKSKYPNAEYID